MRPKTSALVAGFAPWQEIRFIVSNPLSEVRFLALLLAFLYCVSFFYRKVQSTSSNALGYKSTLSLYFTYVSNILFSSNHAEHASRAGRLDATRHNAMHSMHIYIWTTHWTSWIIERMLTPDDWVDATLVAIGQLTASIWGHGCSPISCASTGTRRVDLRKR